MRTANRHPLYNDLKDVCDKYENLLEENYTELSEKIFSLDNSSKNPLHQTLTTFYSKKKNKDKMLEQIYREAREQYRDETQKIELEEFITYSKKTNSLRKACKNISVLLDTYLGNYTKNTTLRKENYNQVSTIINTIKSHLTNSDTETETIDQWYEKYTQAYEITKDESLNP